VPVIKLTSMGWSDVFASLGLFPIFISSFGFAKWFQSSKLLSVASVLLMILICLPYLAERTIGVLFQYPVHGHEILVVTGCKMLHLNF
jgi:hypothetical protein